jgi:phosphate-selective porin OprO/OprP
MPVMSTTSAPQRGSLSIVLMKAVWCGTLVVGFACTAFAQVSTALPGTVVADATRSETAHLAAADANGQEKPKSGTDKPKKKIFVWEDHPSLRLGKGTHIDFRARLQNEITRSDTTEDSSDAPATDRVRRRVGIEGEIAAILDFQVERELDGDNPWRDVYLGYRQFGAVRVRAGKFKLPFSLDENTSATNLDFANRSLAATHLAPGRDRGVMVHGRLLDRVIGYEAGVFNHDGSNARTRNPSRVYGGRTTAGRLLIEPFRNVKKSPLSDLTVGVGMTTSEVGEGRPGLRGRTVLEASFFRSDFLVNGARRRTGVEASWTPGPFSLKSEYIRVVDERRGVGVEDNDLSPLVATGWYVSGTWAITGESKSRGLDSPARPLFQGGFGAVELAARVEALGFGSSGPGDSPSSAPRADDVLGNRDRAETFGVNWYVNRWVKIQLNMIHERLENPAQGPLPGQTGFWSHVLRFQLAL